MIYIGFSKRSHKLYARVLCKNFKHCAPVDIQGNKCLIYQFVHKNKIVISSKFSASDYDELKVYVQEMPEDVIHSVESWLIKTKLGQTVDISFITKQFMNFAKRQGRPIFKEQDK